jgi:hypothetical protein
MGDPQRLNDTEQLQILGLLEAASTDPSAMRAARALAELMRHLHPLGNALPSSCLTRIAAASCEIWSCYDSPYQARTKAWHRLRRLPGLARCRRARRRAGLPVGPGRARLGRPRVAGGRWLRRARQHPLVWRAARRRPASAGSTRGLRDAGRCRPRTAPTPRSSAGRSRCPRATLWASAARRLGCSIVRRSSHARCSGPRSRPAASSATAR